MDAGHDHVTRDADTIIRVRNKPHIVGQLKAVCRVRQRGKQSGNQLELAKARSVIVPALARSAHSDVAQKLTCKTIQDRIYDPRLILLEEGLGDGHILIDHGLGRHIRPPVDLKRSCSQDGTQRCVQARQPPTLGQSPINGRVNVALALNNSPDDAFKEVCIRRQVFGQLLGCITIIGAAQTRRPELGNDVADISTANIHLIKGLHGRKARIAAGLMSFGHLAGLFLGRFGSLTQSPSTFISRLWAIIANAAAAAAPPLFLSSTFARAQAWSEFSTVWIPLPRANA